MTTMSMSTNSNSVKIDRVNNADLSLEETKPKFYLELIIDNLALCRRNALNIFKIF